MKKTQTYRRRPVRRVTTTQRILAYLCFAIIGFTALVTVMAFIINPRRLSEHNSGTQIPSQTVLSSRPSEIPQSLKNQETFTLLGTLRTGTADDPSVPLVVEPWFYYDSTDIQFYQELQQKARKIRTVVTDYFPRYTKDELEKLGEQAIKEQLRNSINQILVLDTIDKLFFNDYTFFD